MTYPSYPPNPPVSGQPPYPPAVVSGPPGPGYPPQSPAPGYGPPSYPAPTPMRFVAARPTSGLAVASMVLGIVGVLGGWCLLGVPCVLAVILGHFALPATRGGEVGGRGMAVAGLVLGYVVVIPSILVFFMIFGTALLGAAGSTTTP